MDEIAAAVKAGRIGGSAVIFIICMEEIIAIFLGECQILNYSPPPSPAKIHPQAPARRPSIRRHSIVSDIPRPLEVWGRERDLTKGVVRHACRHRSSCTRDGALAPLLLWGAVFP